MRLVSLSRESTCLVTRLNHLGSKDRRLLEPQCLIIARNTDISGNIGFLRRCFSASRVVSMESVDAGNSSMSERYRV